VVLEGLLAGEDFVPGDLALARVRLGDGGVEDADGGAPDVAAGAVAFDVRDDGAVGDDEPSEGGTKGDGISSMGLSRGWRVCQGRARVPE
jgi:hypothetical protein